MLRVFTRLAELNFQQLMDVYQEGNRENAMKRYPDDAPTVQICKAEAEFEDYLREDFFCASGAFYAVWEECGRYMSALRMEPYEDGWLLEALETHPAHRRQGWAEKLVNAVLEGFAPGSVIYSHVAKRNTASLSTHKKCGFQIALDYAKYVDGTVTQYACTMKIITPL